MTESPDEFPSFDTYSEMFGDYLRTEKAWIGPSAAPLVHHIRRLCAQLDAAGLDKAALSSAYLQAIAHLEKRRPGSSGGSGGAAGDLPGQTSIFDELD